VHLTPQEKISVIDDPQKRARVKGALVRVSDTVVDFLQIYILILITPEVKVCFRGTNKKPA
jgi:hypothetical protein